MKTAKIQIAPVIGSPDNVARDLQTQLASAIGNRGMTVATAANASSEYVVRGYIVAAREKTKAKISYIWDVTDQSGKRVHRITGEEVAVGAGKDPWAAVTPEGCSAHRRQDRDATGNLASGRRRHSCRRQFDACSRRAKRNGNKIGCSSCRN